MTPAPGRCRSGRRRCNGAGDQRAIVTSLGLGVVCATISILVGAPVAWFLARATTRIPRVLAVAAQCRRELRRHRPGLRVHGLPGHLRHGHAALAGGGDRLRSAQPGVVSGACYRLRLYECAALRAAHAAGHGRRPRRVHGGRRGAGGVAAGSSGASSVLPVLAPFLAAGWLLIFTWSIGIYGLAYALAGNAAYEPAATDDVADRRSRSTRPRPARSGPR